MLISPHYTHIVLLWYCETQNSCRINLIKPKTRDALLLVQTFGLTFIRIYGQFYRLTYSMQPDNNMNAFHDDSNNGNGPAIFQHNLEVNNFCCCLSGKVCLTANIKLYDAQILKSIRLTNNMKRAKMLLLWKYIQWIFTLIWLGSPAFFFLVCSFVALNDCLNASMNAFFFFRPSNQTDLYGLMNRSRESVHGCLVLNWLQNIFSSNQCLHSGVDGILIIQGSTILKRFFFCFGFGSFFV